MHKVSLFLYKRRRHRITTVTTCRMKTLALVPLLGANPEGVGEQQERARERERCFANTFVVVKPSPLNGSGSVFLIQAGCAEAL